MRIRNLKDVRRIVEGVPSFGFRPLSTRETRELFETTYQAGIVQNKLIKKILGMKPVPTWELQKKVSKAYLSGPFITQPSLNTISEGQRELEIRLAKEADRLFRLKYPQRAAIYR